MIKKIIVSLLVLGSVTTANAENVRIAYSKAENVEIFAKNPSPNGEWCADNIDVNVTSGNPNMDFGSQAFDQLIAKVGAAVIEKSCPSATQMTIYHGGNETLIGAAMKNGQWAIIRDAANEEDAPEGESDEADNGNSTNIADSHSNGQSENLQQVAITYPKIREDYVDGKVKEAFDSHKRDMPLTVENVEKVNAFFQRRSNTHQNPVGADAKLEFIKLLKDAIEKDMGYDFDLSFRRAAVFEDLSVYTNAGKVFQDVNSYYINLTNDAMDVVIKDGIFSQETLGAVKGSLYRIKNEQDVSFINMAMKCQSQHGGKFTGSQLVDLYKAEGIIPADENNSALYQRYMGGSLSHASENMWISDASGSRINANFILDDAETKIIVNRANVETALHGALVFEEQKEFFNRLQKMYDSSNNNGNSQTVKNNVDGTKKNALSHSDPKVSTAENNAESKVDDNASISIVQRIYSYAMHILHKILSLFITYPTEIVQNGHLDIDKSLSVGKALDNYKYFKKTGWIEGKDAQGRKIVTFIGRTNFDAYLGYVDPASHWEVSQLAITNAKAIGDNDNVTQMLAIEFSVNDDNTFQAFNAYMGNMKKNDGRFEGNLLPCNVNDVLGIIYSNKPNPLVGLMLWGAEKSQ